MELTQVGETSSVVKAKFKVEGKDQEIAVQFNPEQYSVTESADYNSTKKKSNQTGKIQFLGSKRKTIRLSFFFDTSGITGTGSSSRNETDVSEKTKQISELAKVNGDLHRPPMVTFLWGSFEFKGVITNATTTYTMFDSSGKPIRAKLEIELSEMNDDSEEKKNPTFSPDRTKSRVISEDTDIWALAYKEYGDSNQWRLIAKANNIMNPMEIEAGTVLKVPALIR